MQQTLPREIQAAINSNLWMQKLALALESLEGKQVAFGETALAILMLGQMTYRLHLQIPNVDGPPTLKAAIRYLEASGMEGRAPSRRKVTIATSAA
jgi:hypothetical protein